MTSVIIYVNLLISSLKSLKYGGLMNYGKFFLKIVFLFFIIINYSSCFNSDNLFQFQEKFAPPENTPIEKRVELEKQFTDFLKNTKIVFRIKTEIDNYIISYGTCFLVDNTTVITASHIIEEFYESKMFINNQWNKLNLVNISYTKDIAILKINFSSDVTEIPKFKSIESIFKEFEKQNLAPLEKLLVGMKCMSNEKPRILIGKLIKWDPLSKTFQFFIKNDTHGCSGAPIFTYDGYIIGIHQLQGGLVGEATEIDEVLKIIY